MIPVYYHIPKCAGTYFYNTTIFPSLKLKLRNKYGQNHNIANININGLYMIANLDQSINVSGDINLSQNIIHNYINNGVIKDILGFKITSNCNYIEAKNYIEKITAEEKYYITILRNIPDRINSLFFYLKDYGTWEDNHNLLKDLSFEQYIHSEHMPRNWIVKHLNNKINIPVSDVDLSHAINELNNYQAIGFAHDMYNFMVKLDCDMSIKFNPLNWTFSKNCINKNTKSQNRQMTAEQIDIIVKYNTHDVSLYNNLLNKK